MRFAALTIAVVIALIAAEPAVAESYHIWDDWGGTWSDAEKSVESGDDLLCWAAAAANVLDWTGWGSVGGMSGEDQIFQYLQDHWTDVAGNPWYAWDWWFDGTNNSQGWAGWSQVDVAGGGFYPSESFGDYAISSGTESTIMSAIDTFLHDGYGTSLWVGTNSGGAHLITVWGYDYDPVTGAYLGVHVTDSDDDKNGVHPRPDDMPYYDVEFDGSRWYLQDYYGTDNWYIGWAGGLAAKPGSGPVPEPCTLALLGVGMLGFAGWRRRRKAS